MRIIKKHDLPEWFRFLFREDIFEKISSVYWINRTNNLDIKKTLMQNKKWNNKFSGKRCFILGNGPSLKKVDFKLLKNEFVFTVNDAVRLNNFEMLSSNFHVIIDKAYYSENWNGIKFDKNGINETWDKIKKSNMHIFAPVFQKSKIRSKGIDNKRVSYILGMWPIADKICGDINMCKALPGCWTVVQISIFIAIYMGFEEIYLLGCDNTIIFEYMKKILGEEMQSLHAYNKNNEKEYFEKRLENEHLENALYQGYEVLKTFRMINEYCKDRKIKIANLTEPSLIDSIPKEKLSGILI